MADTRWAVEYESPAAQAFQKNNPNAKVFCNNCNVLLRVREHGDTTKTRPSTDFLLSPLCSNSIVLASTLVGHLVGYMHTCEHAY